MQRAILWGLILLVPFTAMAQELRGTMEAPGFAGEFVMRPAGPPTPRPTVIVTPRPTAVLPPAPCRNGTLNRPLADGGLGRDDVFIGDGETHTYCLPVPHGVRTVVVNEYDQCLGTNLQLRLIPPAGAVFSDGTPVPTLLARSTMRHGGSRKPEGYIPPMTFVLEIVGKEVGPNCSGGSSKYDLRWYYAE